jgi:hypothetical protein
MLITKNEASEIEIKCIVTEIKSEIDQTINSSLRETKESIEANLFILAKNVIKNFKEQINQQNQ